MLKLCQVERHPQPQGMYKRLCDDGDGPMLEILGQ